LRWDTFALLPGILRRQLGCQCYVFFAFEPPSLRVLALYQFPLRGRTGGFFFSLFRRRSRRWSSHKIPPDFRLLFRF